MMMFTLGGVNLINTLIKNLKDFIATYSAARRGTTFEAEPCLTTDLTELDSYDLLESANLIVTPNNYSEARIVPVTPLPTNDIRNILVRTEGKTTSWSTTQVTAIVTSSILDPTGGQNVVRLTEVAATTQHLFFQSIPNYIAQLSGIYTFSTHLKKGDAANAPDIMQLSYGNGFGNFNINTGVATSSGSVFGASMVDAGSGWWRCIISGSTTGITVGTNNPPAQIAFVNNNPNASLRPTYSNGAGATSRNVFVYGAQFEQSLSASAYQRNDITPALTNNFGNFFNSTFTPYWTNSSGLVQNTPYENLIYPSVGISSLPNGSTWRWLYNGLAATNTGLSAPDGTLTASRINLGAGTSRPDYFMTYQTSGNNALAASFPIPKIRTLIVFVKQDSTDRYLGIRLGTNGNTGAYNTNSATIKIDCSNGTLVNNPTDYTITYSSQSVGNGWYKVCISRADAWDSFLFQSSAVLNTVNNTASAGVLIWGVQVVDGTVGISTPVYNREIGYSIPRLDYSGSSCPDYLIETGNTNTLIRSEDFTQATWVKTNVSASASTFLSPTSASYANILTATGSNGIVRQSGTAAITPRQRIFSVYLQRKTGTGPVILSMGSVTGSVNLSTGSWTRGFVVDPTRSGTYTSTSGNITVTTSVAHGYETGDAIFVDFTSGTAPDSSISSITVTGPTTFTFTAGSATTSGNCTIYSNTGKILIDTLGDEVYAWGAQIDISLANTTTAGRIPSTYIPTTTAQVTRTADTTVFNISGSVSSSFYIELSKIGGSALNTLNYITLGNETSHTLSRDSIALGGTTNGGIIYSKKENSGAITNIVNPLPYIPTENRSAKILFITSGSNVNLWMDGSLLSTTTFANPSNLSYLTVTGDSGTTCRLSEIVSWPTILTRDSIDLLFAYPYYNAGYAPVNNELQQVINRAYAEGFTLPSTTKLGYCDTLITAMKNENMWGISDVFFNFAYNDTSLGDFARINWKNPYGSLGLATYAAATSYDADGIRITGTSGFVNTNFNPARASFNYKLNDASRLAVITVYSSGYYIDGVPGQNLVNMIQAGSNSNGLARINAGINTTGTNLTITAQTGLVSIIRYDSTNITVIQRGVVQNTTQTSTVLYNDVQTISRNTNSNSNTHGCYFMGASLTTTQVANFRTAYNTFLTSNGLSATA